MRIETKRTIITEFDLSMAESVHKNSLDEDNRRFVPDEVFETVEDAKETIEFLAKWDKTLDFASFDCCYSLKHCEKGHMGFDEVRTMAEQLKEIGVMDETTVCCINHFSHNNGLSYEKMNEYAKKYGYLTTYDGMEREF